MRLTVIYKKNEVDLSFDYEGFDYLVDALKAMQEMKAPDHDHLMSEA